MSTLLSKEIKLEIDHWIKKYPKDKAQSALLPALHIIQNHSQYNYITKQDMRELAAYLDIPEVSVEAVATFYSMYNLKKTGVNQIGVCTNISCMLRGSEQIMEHIEKKLKINVNQTTSDGNFTLKEVECLGACVGAPMLHINDQYYENLTLTKVDNLLEEFKKNHANK
ncbi:MAG: NAD(P)H-dependent oxidoreductase subunit E [Thiotrichales bacterium]|nr:MAG: NAD(P)H-dependent oxidoreductase subunit E [Thiotrichales bacterium]